MNQTGHQANIQKTRKRETQRQTAQIDLKWTSGSHRKEEGGDTLGGTVPLSEAGMLRRIEIIWGGVAAYGHNYSDNLSTLHTFYEGQKIQQESRGILLQYRNFFLLFLAYLCCTWVFLSKTMDKMLILKYQEMSQKFLTSQILSKNLKA